MPDRPRILWDALLVKPEPTGVGRSVLELARAMSAEDRGFHFTVLCSYPEMFDFLQGTPHWQLFPCLGASGGSLRKALFTQLKLPQLVRQLSGDLLHSHQFIAPWRCPCPSVVTVHDLSYLQFPQTIEQPRRSYYRLFVPHSLRRAARIVTNSATTASDVTRRFPELTSRIQPTRFGTPSWVWQAKPPEQPPPANAPFLFVGTLEPRKNLERLLQAYAKFREVAALNPGPEPPPDLVVAGGKGWQDSRIRSVIQQLQDQGCLHLEGYCDLDRLWELYGSARALLFPSLHEGFGFPILEAMAAGLPVLTSNRGAMREVAGDCAILVDPEDVADMVSGMDRIYRDATVRSELQARGPAHARSFTWAGTATETAAVYRELLVQMNAE
ncbi:MAG: glycosyltransferase family 1 protein [bacterium]